MNYRFKVDYSSAENPCSLCFLAIQKDQLRLAAMIQSRKHDGCDDLWHHKECFFKVYKPHSRDEIHNFEWLKYDDQLDILLTIDPSSVSTLKKVAEKRAHEKPPNPNSIVNFGIEYSTEDDQVCFVCTELIFRNEIRIKKVVYDGDIAARFGREIRWNHLHCFIMQKELYGFEESGYQLPGFKQLLPEHQAFIKEALPSLIHNETIDHESEDLDVTILREVTLSEQELEEKIAKQTNELMRVRSALEKVCSTEQLQLFLIVNESDGSQDKTLLLDRCADFLTFGALYKCQKCFNGDMIFNKHGYTCNAMISDWVKCGHFEAQPMRLKCVIPQDLKHKKFFATCEPRVEHRAVRPIVIQDAEHENRGEENTQPDQTSRQPSVAKIVLKNGTAVDPQSRLENQSHVYKRNGVFYTSVLGFTDIDLNKNSYFKLQVLEDDKNNSALPLNVATLTPSFWVFSSWGRIGTNIGDSLVEPFITADLACAHFEKLYEKHTENKWNSTEAFKKYPGKFYPIDINYSDEINANTTMASQLSPEVEELMKLLFDIKAMKQAMKEYQLDLEKMPLGKLSVNQLQAAYLTLTELEDSVLNGSPLTELVGLSNKFYTLIPHNFGVRKASVINTIAMIAEKREMVDSLLDIGYAYAMMAEADKDLNSFDAYYKQLKAKIEVLDKTSVEFKQIQTYVGNTQMHGYKVELQEVFKVERYGEKDRYAPYKSLHNRQLLWHGSAITNFASIISNGLKITQQVHGSMFGRGIYFADMISKSVNYCYSLTGLTLNSTALLALSEVALGTMYQPPTATNITQLPANTHSTKGSGQQIPDPQGNHTRADGVIIPLGKPIINNQQRAGLLFNEFIVYNEAQVNMQYIVKVVVK